MALRNQPYIPLYVQDFLTDEKLLECSSSSVGVYIMIMCVMHKSKDYGTVLLKQKDKQKDKQSFNFAYKLVKHLPFPVDEIAKAIDELISEDVLQLVGDKLCQKRMIADNELSLKRSDAGKKGGNKTQFDKANKQANIKATSENEYVIENEIIIKGYIEKNCDGFSKELLQWILIIENKYDNQTSIIQIESWLRLLDGWYKTNKQKIECLNKHIAGSWKTLNWVDMIKSEQPEQKINLYPSVDEIKKQIAEKNDEQ